MSKSAAGNVGSTERNVKARFDLNKAMLDQGWFEFRRQLDEEFALNGGNHPANSCWPNDFIVVRIIVRWPSDAGAVG